MACSRAAIRQSDAKLAKKIRLPDARVTQTSARVPPAKLTELFPKLLRRRIRRSRAAAAPGEPEGEAQELGVSHRRAS